ncbi:hypothetical protein V8C37DRAFT_214083 [Trichoderma ceciliae]
MRLGCLATGLLCPGKYLYRRRDREGPRHPLLGSSRARLRWTERSQWLFLAPRGAVRGPSSGPFSGPFSGPCAGPALSWLCTSLCTSLSPLPYIQTQRSTSLSPASPSPILLHSRHLLCAVASVPAIPPVGRGCVFDCEPLHREPLLTLDDRHHRAWNRPSTESLSSGRNRPFASLHLGLHRTTQSPHRSAKRPFVARSCSVATPRPLFSPDLGYWTLNLVHECLILSDELLFGRIRNQGRIRRLVDASDGATILLLFTSVLAQPFRALSLSGRALLGRARCAGILRQEKYRHGVRTPYIKQNKARRNLEKPHSTLARHHNHASAHLTQLVSAAEHL